MAKDIFKSDAEYYRLAIYYVENSYRSLDQNFSCNAISRAVEILNNGEFYSLFIADELRLKRNYADFMGPWEDCIGAWIDEAIERGMIEREEVREWRLTALAFMAAICETEGE